MRLIAREDSNIRTKRPNASRLASVGAPTILLLLLAIAWLDYVTGTAPIQHLYYLPIILSASIFDYWAGLACALVAIVAYHLANKHLRALNYGESDYLQMALFIIVGIVTARLAGDRRMMKKLAATDDLTGLHNLRSFESHLLASVRRARARQHFVSMLVLDVDRLKQINDAHGHLAGAEAVRTVGQIIARSLDGGSVACRYGGDEFAVLSEMDACPTYRTADRLRKAVESHPPLLAGQRFPAGTLTISVGVAACSPIGTRDPRLVGEDLFRAADQALYQAKRDGRNRVRIDPGTMSLCQFQGEN